MTGRGRSDGEPTGRARRRDALRRRVGVDARALAALRVALGLLLLADLLLRSRDLVAFYADAGVLPRRALASEFPAFARLSLHAVSGAAPFQAALFLVAGVAALALVVGYRTRLATALSLLLLVSLHLRNPLVLNAGDALLRRLLLWGLFLPLGGRWSVDAARGDRRTGTVAGAATVALLVQVLVVYLVNAAVKLRGDLWLGGEAVRYVFGLDQLTVLLGNALAGHPALLELLGTLWLMMVVASPLLVLLVGRARTALVALFAGAHLGMLLTLNLGLFPLVSAAALLPFLPPGVWDRAESIAAQFGDRVGARMWIDRVGAAWPAPPALPLPEPPLFGASRLVPGVVAALLALLLVWNAMALGYVATPDAVAATVDPAEYRWDMFAPEPRTVDGWYVVPGRLASGERVDALHRTPVRWDRPPDVADAYPNQRWLVYLLDLRYRHPELRDEFAAHLCRRWNAAGGERLASVTVYYVEQPTRLDGPEPTRRVELVDHECRG